MNPLTWFLIPTFVLSMVLFGISGLVGWAIAGAACWYALRNTEGELRYYLWPTIIYVLLVWAQWGGTR